MLELTSTKPLRFTVGDIAFTVFARPSSRLGGRMVYKVDAPQAVRVEREKEAFKPPIGARQKVRQ